MAFLLFGTEVAESHRRAKLNVRAGQSHRDIGDEDYLPVDNDTESRLERQENNEICYQKNTLVYAGK